MKQGNLIVAGYNTVFVPVIYCTDADHAKAIRLYCSERSHAAGTKYGDPTAKQVAYLVVPDGQVLMESTVNQAKDLSPVLVDCGEEIALCRRGAENSIRE